MVDVAHQIVTRGVNVAPEGGWSWGLTDYEVAYVREFSVRPVREGWPGTPEHTARLDQEADGIRRLPAPPAKQAPGHRLWLWLIVCAAIVAAGAVATVLGITNVTATAILIEQTSILKEEL